jgi:hypothetical protein
MNEYKRYFIVFIITLFLFVTGFFLSDYFTSKKVASLQSIQDQIALNILSSETQFALLSDSTCSEGTTSVLSEQLSTLSDKLDYGERTIGTSNPDMISLRNYFSLLEIKDFILLKQINARCHSVTPYILYFYSSGEDCADCASQWRAISELRDEYPEVRVYVFDYHTSLSAAKTLENLYKVTGTLPAVVIDGKTYATLTNIDTLKKLLNLMPKPVTTGKTSTAPTVTTPTPKAQ